MTDLSLSPDFAAYERRKACRPDCGCGPTFRKLIAHRGRTGRPKFRLVCRICKAWGARAVPYEFVVKGART